MGMRFYLGILLLLVACKGEPAHHLDLLEPWSTVTLTDPATLPPLPEVCQPWKPGPERRLLKPNEVDAVLGENTAWMQCDGSAPFAKDTICETFAQINAMHFEQDHLWLKGDDGRRSPNGGGSDCGNERPWTSRVRQCAVDIRDKNWTVVERVTISCRGDKICDKSADCCTVVSRKYVFEPLKISKEDKARWERERCQGLRERKEACAPFCSRPEYARQCADYWNYTCSSRSYEGTML